MRKISQPTFFPGAAKNLNWESPSRKLGKVTNPKDHLTVQWFRVNEPVCIAGVW